MLIITQITTSHDKTNHSGNTAETPQKHSRVKANLDHRVPHTIHYLQIEIEVCKACKACTR